MSFNYNQDEEMYSRGELEELREALLGIVAAITQTPSENVRKARLASNIAAAKVTGAATSAGIFALVSTLATAGTGTAIGGLSGAAATNATLAWIGGLVGGGMAAGALVLPAVGIGAGFAATRVIRSLRGAPRKLDDLLPFEDEILFCTDQLIRPLDDALQNDPLDVSQSELRVYANDGLDPLLNRIVRHFPPTKWEGHSFSATLKPKYQDQLWQHCEVVQRHVDALLARPRKSALVRAISWLRRSARNWYASVFSFRKEKDNSDTYRFSSVVLVVTFQRLLEDKLTAWGLENDLVLAALRRSKNSLNDASIEELSDYVKALSPEGLRGVVSNTKGIYHELLFEEHHNSQGGAITASVKQATNAPGADVEFSFEGDVIHEIQLKAVESPTLIYEHLSRYPDIEIRVTEEIAAIMDGVDSSGFSNAILSQDVNERLSDLEGEDLIEEVSDGLITSVFVTSGFLAYRILEGKGVKLPDFKLYLANAGIAVGTATAVDVGLSLAENVT